MVARIDTGQGTLALERVVIEQIAADDESSEAEARATGLDTLRLVAARRAEFDALETPPTHPDDLDPARREQLERAAMVRLWLREVFEAEHHGAVMPQRVVDANLADPRVARRLFHPSIWMVCQVLILPGERTEAGEQARAPDPGEPAGAAWRLDAEAAISPFLSRTRALGSELDGEDGCSLLGRLAGVSKRRFETPSGAMILRFESFAFAPSLANSFDEAWVETVTADAEPGLVGPFATQFGVHLVLVTRVLAEHLADGSLPEDELLRARETELREEMEQMWQTEQLAELLDEARERRVVRLARDLERGG